MQAEQVVDVCELVHMTSLLFMNIHLLIFSA